MVVECFQLTPLFKIKKRNVYFENASDYRRKAEELLRYILSTHKNNLLFRYSGFGFNQFLPNAF